MLAETPSKDVKEQGSVLDYLDRVWEEASEPENGAIPTGSVVIMRNVPDRRDYDVWTMQIDDTASSYFGNIRIVSSPPKVGFYLQAGGYAHYWDGSVWSVRKGGFPCERQNYDFSKYIGDVEEDE